jgi:hypothetical protein
MQDLVLKMKPILGKSAGYSLSEDTLIELNYDMERFLQGVKGLSLLGGIGGALIRDGSIIGASFAMYALADFTRYLNNRTYKRAMDKLSDIKNATSQPLAPSPSYAPRKPGE